MADVFRVCEIETNFQSQPLMLQYNFYLLQLSIDSKIWPEKYFA